MSGVPHLTNGGNKFSQHPARVQIDLWKRIMWCTTQGGSNLRNLGRRRRLARNYQPHPSVTGTQGLRQAVRPGSTLIFAWISFPPRSVPSWLWVLAYNLRTPDDSKMSENSQNKPGHSPSTTSITTSKFLPCILPISFSNISKMYKSKYCGKPLNMNFWPKHSHAYLTKIICQMRPSTIILFCWVLLGPICNLCITILIFHSYPITKHRLTQFLLVHLLDSMNQETVSDTNDPKLQKVFAAKMHFFREIQKGVI